MIPFIMLMVLTVAHGIWTAASKYQHFADLAPKPVQAAKTNDDLSDLGAKPLQSAKTYDLSDLAPKPPGLIYTPIPNDDDMGIINYTPGRPIVVTVRLNGRSSARLILDTGADSSMVKPDLLAAAGVDLSRPAARGTGTGIEGTVKLSYFPVDFEIAGHRVRVPRVAAFDTYDDGFADGLLGRDFLDRFKVVMDPAAGTVTLVPR